ncbi:hypothetical protein RM543_05030 [Roseicyclus sp. F158]|uniref:Uncharacterized protein n=1 Tax=Tropicimonas omnivorans TaxID=3075590 RepID=A0ABU3DE95_9RHOB|nr:hypothetical protein [Roseicyclus sp. F158]MDT0682038.1 hypothetical protein [Roseicyclus sp. F158]
MTTELAFGVAVCAITAVGIAVFSLGDNTTAVGTSRAALGAVMIDGGSTQRPDLTVAGAY